VCEELILELFSCMLFFECFTFVDCKTSICTFETFIYFISTLISASECNAWKFIWILADSSHRTWNLKSFSGQMRMPNSNTFRKLSFNIFTVKSIFSYIIHKIIFFILCITELISYYLICYFYAKLYHLYVTIPLALE
jgi:hypothetical protein